MIKPRKAAPAERLPTRSLILRLVLLILAAAPSSLAVSVEPQLAGQKTSAGNFDGPAELPRLFVKSSMSDTPAEGKSLVVNSAESLQPALDNAQCGDTLRLQPAVNFRGTFKFPAKPCGDDHWIIVR